MEYNDATQVIDDESEEDDGDAEQWAVVEMRDGGEEQSHPLFVDPGRTEDRFWIGRDASCEVTLDAASVSRRHAELVVRRNNNIQNRIPKTPKRISQGNNGLPKNCGCEKNFTRRIASSDVRVTG